MNRYKIHNPRPKIEEKDLAIDDEVMINPQAIESGNWNPIYYHYKGKIITTHKDTNEFTVYWYIGDSGAKAHWRREELVRQ